MKKKLALEGEYDELKTLILEEEIVVASVTCQVRSNTLLRMMEVEYFINERTRKPNAFKVLG
jgi:hypothetical protein